MRDGERTRLQDDGEGQGGAHQHERRRTDGIRRFFVVFALVSYLFQIKLMLEDASSNLGGLNDDSAFLKAALKIDPEHRPLLERLSDLLSREGNHGEAITVAQRIDSGICHVNGPTVHDEAQMPFGGVKGSGMGRFGGKAGIAEFTELRWITVQTGERHYPF